MGFFGKIASRSLQGSRVLHKALVLKDSEERVVKQGWLKVRGKFVKTWQTRYFLLRDNGDLLSLHKSNEKPKLLFNVRSFSVVPVDWSKPYVLLFEGLKSSKHAKRVFNFKSAQEKFSWMSAIELVVHGGSDEPKKKKKRKISLDDFNILKVLGQGSFGKVFLAKEKATSHFYAVKMQRKRDPDNVRTKRALTELRILKSLDHPFLISLKYSFQTPSCLFYVMEFANGGELFFQTKGHRTLSEKRARFYTAEITLALGYLHHKDIFYRDLKLGNVLLDREGHVKLVDFGLSEDDFPEGKTTDICCGTPSYLAPEMVAENCSYGRATDWWSLGVATYKMLTGRFPFVAKKEAQLFDMIANNEVEFTVSVSADAQDFITSLMIKDPASRLGGGPDDVDDVKRHKFFSSIDWRDLYDKKIDPPFKPSLSSNTDTRYFNKKFRKELPVLNFNDFEEYENFDGITYLCDDG